MESLEEVIMYIFPYVYIAVAILFPISVIYFIYQCITYYFKLKEDNNEILSEILDKVNDLQKKESKS